MDSDSVDQSKFHGAWPKIIRIHESIVGLKNSRKEQSWEKAYHFSEDLYVELYAWTPAKSREAYTAEWEALCKLTNEVAKTGKSDQRSQLSRVSLKFLLQSMTILKASGLDMEIKKDGTLKGGAIG